MVKKQDNDDIQVINRDDYQFDFPLSPLVSEANNELPIGLNDGSNMNGSKLKNNVNLNNNNNNNNNNMNMNNMNNMNNVNNNNNLNDDDDNEEIEEINGGLTPILNNFDDEHFNNQLIAQPKLYSNLPPMQPLSESVLPQNFNFSLPQITDYSTTTGTNLNSNINNNNANANSNSNNKKRKDNGPKTRPGFVMKIWSMVNDEKNKDYIRWDEDGKTFQVFQREEFMKNILPKYFKHNNFASFVRQLNMYGWHKVQDINNGLLKDDKSIEENWKFENPSFQRGREDLLDNIVRNKSIQQDNELVERNQNLKQVLNELESIKLNQLAITEDLRRIRKDNKTLWQENFITRERHSKQTQTIDKILKFLASIYGQQNKILEVEDDLNLHSIPNNININNNNSSNLNNNNSSNSNNNVNNFNNDLFEELPSSISSPKPRQRLMLMDQAYKNSPSTSGGSIDGESSNNNNSNNSSGKNSRQTPINSIATPSTRNSISTPRIGMVDDSALINGLEQNIQRQGQSIQQVQDWIHKLSSQQQQLQIQQDNLQNQQNQQNQSRTGSINGNGNNGNHIINNNLNGGQFLESNSGTPKFDLDFDMNEFINQNTPVNEEEEYQPKRKKFKTDNIKELDDVSSSQIKELN